MSVGFNGTNAKLQLGPTTLTGLSYPLAFAIWTLPTAANVNYMVAGLGQNAGTREAMIYAEGAGSGKMRAFARTPSTGATSTANISAAAWKLTLCVYESDTLRRVWHDTGTAATDTTALDAGLIAALDRVVVGVRGQDETLWYSGLAAHFAIWSGGTALGQTQFDALAGGAVPSSVSSGTLWDYWALASNAATHTGVNGRVLTSFGGTSTGGSDPPVGLGFGAGATLARTTAGGSLSAVASAFAAGATLARTTAAGTLGPTPGVITSQPLRTNNGTLLASTALDYVDVYLEASGVFVGRFTGLSTNGAGVFTVVSGLITPGTAYKLDWRATGGQRRMPPANAT